MTEELAQRIAKLKWSAGRYDRASRARMSGRPLRDNEGATTFPELRSAALLYAASRLRDDGDELAAVRLERMVFEDVAG